MRAILCISLFLFGAFWVACEWQGSQEKPAMNVHVETEPAETHWVRTTDGWEKTSDWVTHAQPWQPTLHPGIVASLQVLITLLAFISVDGSLNEKKERLAQPER